MAYTTKKPTGLTIKRSGTSFIISWKIADKDYNSGQTLQYRCNGGAWADVAVATSSTKASVTISGTAWYPNTSKVLNIVHVRIRGKRGQFTENGKTVKPDVSEWATKDYNVDVPSRPSLTEELSSESTNVTTFTWETPVADDVSRWFTDVQCQTRLERNSNITDGSKLSHAGWSSYYASAASGSAEIIEDSGVVNAGVSYTRWFRIRSRGPKGYSDWVYAKHVYAVPYQTKNVRASASTTDAGGYLCTATWSTPRDAAHPVDGITVQYAFAVPAAGMTCPDTASWQDAQSLTYKDGSDASAFSIDSQVGTDQCLFVRINTIHDRNTTYGSAVAAAVGALAAPTAVSVSTDGSTYKATITATNASTVADSFLVVKYMTADEPDGFDIGVIAHGETSVIVQCPEWTSTSDIKFGVYAVVGSAEATTRADGVASYAVTAEMQSAMTTTGGTVPAAPQTVTLAKTARAGTIRVAWMWSWAQATAAELSWADHEDAWESTDEPNTYIVSSTHTSAWNISGLDTGIRWYVRVRLISGFGDNQSFGAYSDIVSIDLSSAPAVPVLSLSSAVITEQGSVTASWAYSSGDGSPQASAEVAEVTEVENELVYTPLAVVESSQHVSVNAADAGWSTGETHDLVVRVTSASGKQSEWSDPVSVVVAAAITATITATSLLQQTVVDGGISRRIYALTEMPLSVTVTGAGSGGTTAVIVERAEDYHVDRPDETDFNGYEGETVAMRSQMGEGTISFSTDDLIGSLDDGAAYRIIATVSDGLGQTATAAQGFEVRWTHQALLPSGTVTVDNTNMIAVIAPEAPVDADETDVCDIYRLSTDRPELIFPGATFGEDYVDPYPAIGEHGGYRLVFRTANGDYITEDDELAWTDISAGLETDHNIIDFGKGRVTLDYNVDLTNGWVKDFSETKYLGGSVQGDWNPAVSRTGTLTAVTVTDDADTIEAMRRLAVWPGICHVRTKDGSSYAADVQVSEAHKQDTAHAIIEFTLAITRVDAETYDGMTLDAWEETNAVE